jgi:hypothetical protein
MFCQCTLPNSYDAPPGSPQCSRNALISTLIAVYFFTPQRRVAFWFKISLATMTVPKATVNEHCQFRIWKNKVGFAKQGKITTPSPEPGRAQKRNHF